MENRDQHLSYSMANLSGVLFAKQSVTDNRDSPYCDWHGIP